MPQLPPQKLFRTIHRHRWADTLSRLCRTLQPRTEVRLQLYTEDVLRRESRCKGATQWWLSACGKACKSRATTAIIHRAEDDAALDAALWEESSLSLPENGARQVGSQRADATLQCRLIEALDWGNGLLASRYFGAYSHWKSDALQPRKWAKN